MNTVRQSLLGAYPVTALHMVGTPPRPTPGLPSQWQPSLPPAQYGIDYTFLQQHGGRPVRWRPDLSITIRIAGPHLGKQVQTTAARNIFSGLTPGQVYFVQLNAVGSAGPSDWSDDGETMVM